MELFGFACFNRDVVRYFDNIKFFKIKISKKDMEKKFFERKGVTWVFSAIALISGVVFLDSNPTGNVIVNNKNSVSIISLLGLLLILCSVILITYSVKKK